jgi:hypothetical protein
MAHGPYTFDRELRPTGYQALAYAVVTQGLHDAVKGSSRAREWLDGRDFEYWCDWCDLNPDYIRGKVMALIKTAPTIDSRERMSYNTL